MKKLLTFLFLFLTIELLGQTQQPENKKIFEKGDSIVWNKALPVYIHVSTGKDGYTYDVPFYLDTEGVNFIRTKWEVDSNGVYVKPQREQLWRIYADSKPPKTKVTFIASHKYVHNGKTYYGDDLRAKLTSVDAMAGVQKTYYSINGGNFVEYIDLIPFKSESNVVFKFYSVDNVGNVESIEEISYNYDNNNLNFGIDDIAPVTSISKADSILSPKDVITLSSKDIGVGVGSIFYRIDSAGYKPYDNPIILNKMSDGMHNIEYYALDWINNQEESKHYSFYLDSKSPEIKIEEEIIENSVRSIKLDAVDNKSGVKKILVQLKENEKFVEYKDTFTIDVQHQKIKIISVDNMGNVSVRTVIYSKN